MPADLFAAARNLSTTSKCDVTDPRVRSAGRQMKLVSNSGALASNGRKIASTVNSSHAARVLHNNQGHGTGEQNRRGKERPAEICTSMVGKQLPVRNSLNRPCDAPPACHVTTRSGV